MAVGARPGIVTRGPHLVLPNVGDNDRLSTSFCANSLQDGGWIRILLIALHCPCALGILSFPRTYFADPRPVFSRLNRCGQSSKSSFRIGDNWHSSDFDFVYLRSINVYMNNARFGGKFTDLASDAIIKTHANGA